ncbi:MAG: hypothetical protein LC808_42535, partial [Actinobacteria bacterium]|nr:hypothetical protein [Actinomycetota bacterium]
VAVGGYGRGDLSPHSDIDLLFLVTPRSDISAGTLRGLLYPLWDAGFQVGHAVRTPKEAVERAVEDLDSATSVLSARLVAGDAGLFDEFTDRHLRWLRKERVAMTRRILDATNKRHQNSDRAGWALAPDIKDDVGGLRDLHALYWLGQVTGTVVTDPYLGSAGDLLLAVRESLHAEVKRKSDRIRIDLQPVIAHRMGLEGADAANELMSQVHSAARTIEHGFHIRSGELGAMVLGGPKRSGVARLVAPAVRIEDGKLHIDPGAGDDSIEEALQLLQVTAETGRPLATSSLLWLEATFNRDEIEHWSEGARQSFLALLAGLHATETLELLDQVGGWPVLLPEWLGIRGLAQHDPYHRYTVDGHSFIAVGTAHAACSGDSFGRAAAAEAGDLSSLHLAALLHDVG